ncbi:THO complex subunit 1 [Diorhabda sublineata]|uniref:THO complex subunit 1 n=1 Tax=Diorhabda sublineata TaxID=1163346 RepID=UPI0024E0CC95|nr:THO complex subunit 1 [Diorhabda sublineata]XP_056629585.1 THO complex subunit 1 [Diorhabda sublineata]XP_056629586.1 THO complex subunit 1 [Diorhabda sublineata]
MNYNFEFLRKEYKNVLQKSFKTNNVDLLEQKVKSFGKTEIDLKSPLDQTLRDLLLNILEEEKSVVILKDYVDFSILLCRKGLSSPTIPVVLLGDIFETLTLDICENMFSFVEQNVHVWKEELFFSGCKNNLLRLCNDLLRRLSRTTATVFCGKILLFLAKFFPFSERSGLNIVSEFNLENVTEYGTDPTDDDGISDISKSGEEKNIIDFTFYCKFWQLQDFFRNPNQCYNKVQWKLFSSHATNVLNTFQGIKLDYVTSTEKSSNLGYFAKYLTSQKLLDLQLHDVNFRRSVLLQFLIVFQYFTSTVKFKSDAYELKNDQKEWISTNTEKVYNLLRETPPDGEEFAQIVKNLMHREELWNAWKNDSCPEIKKTLPQPVEVSESKKDADKRLLGDIIKEANNQGKYFIGSGELTKLWNQCPNNLEACKGRNFLPTLEEFFSEPIQQLETNHKIDDSILKDGNLGWRALRLLARRSPQFFTYGTTVTNSLSSYLEVMIKKIAHEKPGKEVTQENQNDSEMDNILTETDQATDDLKPTDQEEFVEDTIVRPERKNITLQQLMYLSEKIAPNWQKLATKLGFKKDEIEFFEKENPTPIEQARNLLQLWFEDDEDATLENLAYTLEGLEMNEAAEAVKSEINMEVS